MNSNFLDEFLELERRKHANHHAVVTDGPTAANPFAVRVRHRDPHVENWLSNVHPATSLHAPAIRFCRMSTPGEHPLEFPPHKVWTKREDDEKSEGSSISSAGSTSSRGTNLSKASSSSTDAAGKRELSAKTKEKKEMQRKFLTGSFKLGKLDALMGHAISTIPLAEHIIAKFRQLRVIVQRTKLRFS